VSNSAFLQLLDLGVERLNRVEVPVDDVVEHAPQQERHAVAGELGRFRPNRRRTGAMSNPSSLAHRDERARSVTNMLISLVSSSPRGRVEADRVGVQEEVRVVAIELSDAGARGPRPRRPAGAG